MPTYVSTAPEEHPLVAMLLHGAVMTLLRIDSSTPDCAVTEFRSMRLPRYCCVRVSVLFSMTTVVFDRSVLDLSHIESIVHPTTANVDPLVKVAPDSDSVDPAALIMVKESSVTVVNVKAVTLAPGCIATSVKDGALFIVNVPTVP